MATKRKFPEDHTFLFTATTTAKSSGDVCLMTEIVGIALADIDAAGTGSCAVRGVWTMTKGTAAAFPVGDSAYYASGTGKLSLTATSNYYTGKVYTAATTGQTTVEVVLNFGNAGPR